MPSPKPPFLLSPAQMRNRCLGPTLRQPPLLVPFAPLK
jgi:hypothetical protein